MKSLIVGASGATGSKVVHFLLEAGQEVKIVVRPTSHYPEQWNQNDRLTIIKGSILDMSPSEVAECLSGCDSIVSCLGHKMSWKGIYGKPRRLVADSVRRICESVQRSNPTSPARMVLMNTTGYRNRHLNEARSIGERLVIALLRLLLPPHPDNEAAADYLLHQIGASNPHIQWVVVRPDNLTNEEVVTKYSLHPSPLSSPIFKAKKTSKINAAHFMSRLLLDSDLWNTWKGKTPVIYNEVQA